MEHSHTYVCDVHTCAVWCGGHKAPVECVRQQSQLVSAAVPVQCNFAPPLGDARAMRNHDGDINAGLGWILFHRSLCVAVGEQTQRFDASNMNANVRANIFRLKSSAIKSMAVCVLSCHLYFRLICCARRHFVRKRTANPIFRIDKFGIFQAPELI